MQRLRLSRDIQAVYQHGAKRYHPLFRVISKKTNQPDSRATVVVSKRVSKKAVERNRIKRRLRPLLKAQLATIQPPRDVVVLVQARALAATSQQLTQALQRVL